MSLARAFAYAGCPGIVMSHWTVNDESTAKLMSYFYTEFSKGSDRDVAMQQAKLNFLEEEGTYWGHPLYWGSFVVLGDTSVLNNTGQSFGIWLLTISFMVVIVFSIFLFKRNKNKSL